MEKIEGLTRKKTINVLKRYCVFNTDENSKSEFKTQDTYVCNYVYFNSKLKTPPTTFFRFWYEKIYEKEPFDGINGFFGSALVADNNLDRLAFVLLIINEIENG